MSDLLLFVAAAATLLAVPGPTNTVMAIDGAARHPHSPWRLLLAMLAGYLAVIVLSRLLLLPLIAVYPAAGVALKLVVVAYLVYAAVLLWRSRISLDADVVVGPRIVFLTTLFNPKGLVLAVSIFPEQHPQLLVHFIVFAALVCAAGYGWILIGRGLAALTGSRASLLPRTGSVALLGFAALLVAAVAR